MTDFGILTGPEISAAVTRHKRYLEVQAKEAAGEFVSPGLMMGLKNAPRIVIDGFEHRFSHEGGQLNPNSYNLTLAPELLVYAHKTLDMYKNNPTRQLQIPEAGFVLQPGELYLGRTNEHTETFNLVPWLDGRSSIGRLGIAVHITAARGDNGYIGTWTLEISAVKPVRIYPNTQVCQITYFTIAGRGVLYRGRYQNAKEIATSRFYLDGRK